MYGWTMGWMWVWPVLARQILDERFARGEIDAEEYRRRRAELY